MIFPTRGRWWPRGGGADLYRVEDVLATARVILGLGLVAALAFNPAGISGGDFVSSLAAHLLLLGYSLLLLTVIKVRKRMSPMLGIGMHLLDMVWAVMGTTVIDRPVGTFSVFSVFAIVAAAYRWGLWETLATAGAVATPVIVQAALQNQGNILGPGFAEIIVSTGVAFWLLNLVMLAWLLGYLGEEEKALRYEGSSAGTLMAAVQRERRLGESLRTAAAEMMRIFSAREFLLVTEEVSTGRLFLTSGTRVPRQSEVRYANLELPADVRQKYLFPGPTAWSVIARAQRTGAPDAGVVALDDAGQRVQMSLAIPPEFRASHPFRNALAASFRFDDAWIGRMFLLDVPSRATELQALQFLQRLVGEVAPALHELYLIRRLRNQVGATERARVARELHDGVIQALIGVEMRLDVLQRQTPAETDRLQSEIGELKHLVHDEVLQLRDLLQHMKPPDPGPNLANYLSELVDRYRRDTGIAATFVSDAGDTPLGSATRRQLVRIVQEALVNIRKHSGARNVIIRMEHDAASCRLVFDDDGKGYDFSGRLTMEELDRARRGPVVIKERVRDIRGTVAIESVPGRGSRLEIVVPRRL